ncbi:MFS transporter [Pseudomonas syringae]|uniref:MFS transporter n=1 Tax=Pseudomonas syringae TaxID=317 RepID=UPI003F74BADB
MNVSDKQRRTALCLLFFIAGVAMASWITRTPAIRDAIDVSLTGMGLVLLCISAGSIVGILLSGFIVERCGCKGPMLWGLTILACGLLLVASGCRLAEPQLVGLGFLFFGLGMGLAEVAINLDGAAVEKIQGTPLMHVLHGCYSLGTVIGSIVGFAIAYVELEVHMHLCLAAAAIIPPLCYAYAKIPVGKPDTAQQHNEPSGWGSIKVWLDYRLGLLAIIILFMGLGEGAANDWLPILLVDEHGFSQANGSLGFLLFAVVMTLTRLTGGGILRKLGNINTIRLFALFGIAGVLLMILTDNDLLASVGIMLWAMGIALGFPVAISMASESGRNTTLRVNFLTIVGYIAFLVSPPSLGLVGEFTGLRYAMLAVVIGLVMIVLVSSLMMQSEKFKNGRSSSPAEHT